MSSKEEIESSKIILHNIRAESLIAIQCSLADIEDKEKWLKEIDAIDNIFNYIKQLESDNYEANNRINEYIEDRQRLIEKLEEDIEEYRKEIENTHIKLNQIHYMKRIEYAKEILELVKGGNK